jgi:hypothetical protein
VTQQVQPVHQQRADEPDDPQPPGDQFDPTRRGDVQPGQEDMGSFGSHTTRALIADEALP